MIISSAESIDFTQFSSFIRKSDSFILIAPNLCAVIFDFANDSNGVKTANKLLAHLQQTYRDEKIYSCIVTASNHEGATHMVNELCYLLKYALANYIDDTLVDSSYLSKIYVEVSS